MPMKLTYLFGAGASFNKLPVIANFNEHLKLYRDNVISSFVFEESDFPNGLNIQESKEDVRNLFLSDLDWLIKESNNHSSIDTFARKLYLTKKSQDYIKLKLLVSEFLTYKEFKKGIDPRYDSFFATTLDLDNNGNVFLPENIRILSWNYDKQIELSAGQFLNNKESDFIEDFLQVFPRKNGRPEKDSFSIFKLNGTTGGTIAKNEYKPSQYNPWEIGKKLTDKKLDDIISNSFFRYIKAIKNFNISHYDSNLRYEYSIHYSWEDIVVVKQTREAALKATKDTSILTIIGYSFPTFNRKLDSLILNNMDQLEKIYLQLPSESINGVKKRIEALLEKDIQIVPIDDVSEFYIPFEFA